MAINNHKIINLVKDTTMKDDKLAVGTRVTRSGYAGVVICEYLPDMYEVRLASGVVVVPREELKVAL